MAQCQLWAASCLARCWRAGAPALLTSLLRPRRGHRAQCLLQRHHGHDHLVVVTEVASVIDLTDGEVRAQLLLSGRNSRSERRTQPKSVG